MDVHEIRLRNYKTLLTQFKQKEVDRGMPERGTLNHFGEVAGVSPRFLSHVNNGRKNIGEQTARLIEKGFKLPHGWMDHDHLAGPAPESRSEREYVELALRLFRQNPIEAQAVLLRYMAERVMGAEPLTKPKAKT